jgi:hypothetical protein
MLPDIQKLVAVENDSAKRGKIMLDDKLNGALHFSVVGHSAVQKPI